MSIPIIRHTERKEEMDLVAEQWDTDSEEHLDIHYNPKDRTVKMTRKVGTYKLNFGPVGNAHSEETYPTQYERIAQMWAMRLCNHPETAWYNDPRDPGYVSNEGWTKEMAEGLSPNMKKRIQEIISEDNYATAEDIDSLNDPTSNTIEEAAANLIEAAERGLKLIKYGRVIQRKERESIQKQLEDTIEDMRLWMEGVAEANQTPMSAGLVDGKGRP